MNLRRYWEVSRDTVSAFIITLMFAAPFAFGGALYWIVWIVDGYEAWNGAWERFFVSTMFFPVPPALYTLGRLVKDWLEGEPR